MKYFFSLFLVITMIASITLPLIEQWQGENMCQQLEDSSDDANDDFKVEKENEIYTYNNRIQFEYTDINLVSDPESTQYYKHDKPIYECHAFLPEIPPES